MPTAEHSSPLSCTSEFTAAIAIAPPIPRTTTIALKSRVLYNDVPVTEWSAPSFLLHPPMLPAFIYLTLLSAAISTIETKFTKRCSVVKDGRQCAEVFFSTQPLHANATFVCKHHPSTEQVRAAEQFSHNKFLNSVKHETGKSITERFVRRTNGVHTNEEAEKETLCGTYQLCASSLNREIETDDWCGYEISIQEIIANSLLRRKKEFTSAIGKNPNDQFENSLLSTVRGTFVSDAVKTVDADESEQAERAASGRPNIFPEDERSSVGVSMNPLTRRTVSQTSCSGLPSEATTYDPLVQRKRSTKSPAYKISPDLIARLKQSEHIPDFIEEPRPLHATSISGHLWSQHIAVGESKSTARKELLLVFGTNLGGRADNRLTLPIKEEGEAPFQTLRQSTKARELPRIKAYEATRQMIVFGLLNRKGQHSKDEERRFHACLEIEFKNVSIKDAADRCEISERQMERDLSEWRYKVRDYANNGGSIMFDFRKITRADFKRILDDGGVYAILPRRKPAPYEPYAIFEIHGLPVAPRDRSEVLNAFDGLLDGLREPELLADLKTSLIEKMKEEKGGQARLKRSRRELEEAVHIELDHIETQFAEAMIEDFGPPGWLETTLKAVVASTQAEAE